MGNRGEKLHLFSQKNLRAHSRSHTHPNKLYIFEIGNQYSISSAHKKFDFQNFQNCAGMPSYSIDTADMNLCTITRYAFTEDSADGRMKTITWLQAHRLLANIMTCNQCGIS